MARHSTGKDIPQMLRGIQKIWRCIPQLLRDFPQVWQGIPQMYNAAFHNLARHSTHLARQSTNTARHSTTLPRFPQIFARHSKFSASLYKYAPFKIHFIGCYESSSLIR
jgi:hypothetical protein